MPESHPCGNLNLIFPFTDIQKPKCGLFMVDGCNPPHPDRKVQLDYEGLRFDLLNISENDISIRDRWLNELLNQRRYLDLRNFSLPKSPFASLKLISPYRNLSSCFYDCKERTSNSVSNCSQSTLLYDYEHAPNRDCSVIQVPIIEEHDPYSNFSLRDLASNFTLAFHVFDDCLNCHHRGVLVTPIAPSTAMKTDISWC